MSVLFTPTPPKPEGGGKQGGGKEEAGKGEDHQEELELAKRAFALKKYEAAVEHYSNALEIFSENHGQDVPEIADLYFEYGRALLEHAISQSSVLGKANGVEEEEEGEDDEAPTKGNNLFSFGGDDEPVNLFEAANKAIEEADAEGRDDEYEGAGEGDEEEGEGEGEPEDDFNEAWDILDLARTIYQKRLDSWGAGREQEEEELKLKLADTYVMLGDVSLETEKFDQAVSDYETSLTLKRALLPLSSRQIAEAHYKLSIVLDMTPGRLADAIGHAESARESLEVRVGVLRGVMGEEGGAEEGVSSAGTGGSGAVAEGAGAGSGGSNDAQGSAGGEGSAASAKGKAKAKEVVDLSIVGLSRARIEAEIKDLEELKADLELKIEELKTQPHHEPSSSSSSSSVMVQAADALDAELGRGLSRVEGQQPVVNDLSGMVKRRRKDKGGVAAASGSTVTAGASGSASAGAAPVQADSMTGIINGSGSASGTKRKAEDDAEGSGSEKKTKVD
ncbi:hypothetical protein CYLTODRAFT_421225 [Cylindrobasidium torrendii FP15055 ss-10]|uniref:Tetratricopeptide SHNi-TPR domain-containing protein n=1 Tax=Cylindrobasidium torrendii FP15055 ss-10 TaxID=1314674 RepID=A0A0D7BFB1_9AGAR|nr:hypothetical protein CYLTODRAFT_421225 [Cylindrobasidium torrendii FP15055 ss-10]